MKPKDYYEFIDDKTGVRYIAVPISHQLYLNNPAAWRNMAITRANKIFKTKKGDLVVGVGYMNAKKLVFFRSYGFYGERIIRPYKDPLAGMGITIPNCLVVARRKK